MSAYVALGDSYAAGIGAGEDLPGPRRTDAGYPLDVARATGLDLTYQAVLGATTGDLLRDQVQAVTGDTELVTITIGGNDAGFVPVLLEVTRPAWFSDSDTAIDRAVRTIEQVLPGRLAEVLQAVSAAAPPARVLITGYPRLFNGISDCSWLTFVSPEEMRRLDHAADALAEVILTAAADHDCEGVDLRAPFDGHQICDEVAWIHGLSWPVEESYHPNAAGHQAYGEGVIARLAVSEPAPRAAPRLRLGECRGSAPTLALPDLLSAESLLGARAHGLDPDDVATAGRAVTDPGLPPDLRQEAAAELAELDARVRARR
ncbi:hypothetical protein GCM10022199_02750 [Marihabitans asiaticum]|uniref:Lysophospholipase L1-like esterase n=1 Tax=Marihabitans asiaticum TaxID=415218 RepID=A0A560WEE6_9MICO|nr:SGNH/GDSL hydrolase family protein [Marihabitans asiaticum]TWD16049.1 lysophospholipase L1-like esterase [Marihabitans asiaticum]